MRRPHAVSAPMRLLLLAGLALAGTGCARLFSSYDVAPNGLSRRDDALRRLLAAGRPDSALVRVAPEGESAPEDELLRSLYVGLLAHYSGAYDTSGAALGRAARLAEDRYTKSLSRAALSLLSNDKVLPYEPGWTERLLIPYYGALNYLERGDLDGAAVEARRLGFLLEQEAERDAGARHRPTLALLRYFTGTIFEAAGERNDAAVAYRNAWALAGAESPLPAEAALPDSLGEVVVLIERGFVAHRVEQALVVPLHGYETQRLTGGETGERLATATGVAARVMARALAESGPHRVLHDEHPRTLHVPLPPVEVKHRDCVATRGGKGDEPPRDPKPATPAPRPRRPHGASSKPGGDTVGRIPARPAPWGGRVPARPRERCPDEDEDPYLLKIAWPVFRQDHAPGGTARIIADSSLAATVRFHSDVSDAVVLDFEQERALLLARTIARAISKMALTRGLENELSEENESLGQVVGLLVNFGTALLEQADTRSWQLLPARIGIARVRLPPGTHQLALQTGAESGRTRRIPLRPVEVRPGRITFVSARVWR